MAVDLLEALTIFCFGLSWPISIRKSLISRTAKGKSLFFEVFLLIGYIGASAVKYAVLWLVVNKVLTRYSSLVTLFQNLDNEAAEQAAVSLMKAQTLHGQLVCALLGGLTAFLLLPMLKEFLRKKFRA